MATAFIAIAAGASAAPLNPAYRADEFEFYLSDLNAKGLVVRKGSTSPRSRSPASSACGHRTRAPARARGGRLRAARHVRCRRSAPAQAGMAQPDDVALVLHTSGTTSRPKIVPLTQRNVCASARNIREALR